MRLRPDGEPLQLVMFVYTARGPWMVEMAEMYKQYWSDLGVDVLLKPFGEGVWNKIFVESDWHLAMSQAFGGMKGYPAISRGEIVPIHARFGVTPRWAQWIVTDGAEGVEPPADVKRLAEIPQSFHARGGSRETGSDRGGNLSHTPRQHVDHRRYERQSGPQLQPLLETGLETASAPCGRLITTSRRPGTSTSKDASVIVRSYPGLGGRPPSPVRFLGERE